MALTNACTITESAKLVRMRTAKLYTEPKNINEMGSQEKEMMSKIKARRDDYYSKSLNAELRKERDNKNHEVLNHVINELNARSSELTWVLKLIEK